MPRLKHFYRVPQESWILPENQHENANSAEMEEIRQWILSELTQSYGYPPEFLRSRTCSDPFHENPSVNTLSFALQTEHREPFLIVVVAGTGQIDEAELTLRSLLSIAHTAGCGIATDGSIENTRFIRRRFDTDKCDYIVDLEMYASGGKQLVLMSDGAEDEAGRRVLKPLIEGIEDLFFEIHSHIRDIDGLHADEALDELCKLIYAKIHDEETCGVTSPRFQRWLYGSTEEFAAALRGVYQLATEYDVRVFALRIPGYTRSRGVFNTPLRLSSPALVKAAESLQDYSLTMSPVDVKGRAFQRVLGPAVRAGMGQYFTPDTVVEFMCRAVTPTQQDLVLDPFCGSAHFLTTCLRLVREGNTVVTSKAFHEFAFGKLHGIEKSDRMVRVAMTDMRLNGDGHSNIRCTDSLLAFENYPDIVPESFDLVLTNPPFGSLLGSEALGQLGQFELARDRRSMPLEILGLERCIQFLRPGGRLGIVLPEGVLANRGNRHVRTWLESKAKIRALISLPIETFSPFGANIKTSILFARKWMRGERRDVDYPVFMARVDSVGYDASGRPKADADLEDVVQGMLDFLAEEDW